MRAVLAALWALGVTHVASAQTRSTPQESARAEPSDRSYWHLSSDTTFVAYEIRSPTSPVSFERRRLVQRVGLEHVVRPGPEDSPWRIVTALDLRLDQEMGQVCRRVDERCVSETFPEARRDYQVLVENGRLDAPRAYIEARRLDSRISLRGGRQLLYDATGFVRLDGLTGTIRPLGWLDLQAYGGLQAIGTSFMSQSGFETQGAIRIDLPENLAPDRVPFVAPPSRRWVLGGSIGMGQTRWIRGRLAFREIQDGDGLVSRRLAGVLVSEPHRRVRLQAQGAWDPTDWTLVDGLGQVSVRLESASMHVRVEHHEPRFDLGTIWAFFDVVPMSELQLALEWSPTARWSWGGAARGRRIELDGDNARTDYDLGGDGWIRYKRGGWDMTMRGWLWAGDLGPVAAVMLNLSKRLKEWAELYMRASVWHFDSTGRAELYATSVAGAVGARVTLSDVSVLRLEVEYAHNRLVGHRFRSLASLTLRAWR